MPISNELGPKAEEEEEERRSGGGGDAQEGGGGGGGGGGRVGQEKEEKEGRRVKRQRWSGRAKNVWARFDCRSLIFGSRELDSSHHNKVHVYVHTKL